MRRRMYEDKRKDYEFPHMWYTFQLVDDYFGIYYKYITRIPVKFPWFKPFNNASFKSKIAFYSHFFDDYYDAYKQAAVWSIHFNLKKSLEFIIDCSELVKFNYTSPIYFEQPNYDEFVWDISIIKLSEVGYSIDKIVQEPVAGKLNAFFSTQGNYSKIR